MATPLPPRSAQNPTVQVRSIFQNRGYAAPSFKPRKRKTHDSDDGNNSNENSSSLSNHWVLPLQIKNKELDQWFGWNLESPGYLMKWNTSEDAVDGVANEILDVLYKEGWELVRNRSTTPTPTPTSSEPSEPEEVAERPQTPEIRAAQPVPEAEQVIEPPSRMQIPGFILLLLLGVIFIIDFLVKLNTVGDMLRRHWMWVVVFLVVVLGLNVVKFGF